MIFENYPVAGSRRVGSDDYKAGHSDRLLRLMRSCTGKPNDSPSVRRSNELRAGRPDTACLLSGGRRQLHRRPGRAGLRRQIASATDWTACVGCVVASRRRGDVISVRQVCVCVCVLSWSTRRLISQDVAPLWCDARFILAQALSYIRFGLPDSFHGSSDYLAALCHSAASCLCSSRLGFYFDLIVC